MPLGDMGSIIEMNINISVENASIEALVKLIEMQAREKDCQILDRDISNGVSLNAILDEVKAHYINRALDIHNGKVSAVADTLGFHNYQTCANWVQKYRNKL